jgi:succinate dehydrogenase / fumarate reductase, membrane anchor subunit
MSESLRTPLSRVRGLGSAKGGTDDFIGQRVSGIALFFLVPWFVISAALYLLDGFEGARDWIANPLNAVGTILLLLASLYHARIGMQTIIEDYIHKAGTKLALGVANAFIAFGFAALGVFAVLKLSLGV